MNITKANSYYGRFFLLLNFFLVLAACDGSSGSKSPDKLGKLSNYLGEWFQNGTTGTMTEEKTFIINQDASFTKITDEFESTDKVSEKASRVTEGVITEISTNEDNKGYDSIYMNIDTVTVTPRSSDQAQQWNNNEYGGLTTWVKDQKKVFDSENSGEWDNKSIWQINVMHALKLEGELLVVNERAGFDGDDPEDEVYFKVEE